MNEEMRDRLQQAEHEQARIRQEEIRQRQEQIRREAGAPFRRVGEPDHKGNGLSLHGPAWLGSISVTGQNAIVLLGIVVFAAVGGAHVYYNARSDEQLIEALRISRQASSREHRAVVDALQETTAAEEELLCMLTLINSPESVKRAAAGTPGGACAFVGLRPHRRTLPPMTDEPVR